MIHVIYSPGNYWVSVSGHAQSAEKGHDLICAAASMLAYTLAANVVNFADQEKAEHPVTKLLEGDTVISCEPKWRYRKILRASFDSVCAGFALLAQCHPDHISYEIW